MKKIKIDSNHILIGAFLLIVGMILGISLGSNGTFALEGSSSTLASSNNATAANASATNASAANASVTNASAANASATNASAANASRTDNTLYLNAFSLATGSAKPGDKVFVGKMTSGACNSGMTIQFNDVNNPVTQFTVNVENMAGTPYFVVPKNVLGGTYIANKIVLIGSNSDKTTFSRCYGHIGVPSGCQRHEFEVKLKIEKDAKQDIKLETLTLSEKEALLGEKVNVNYKANDTLTSLRLFFKSGDNTFNAAVLDLGDKAYFNIPSNVKTGEYELIRAVVMSDTASIVYVNGDNYNFNTKLNVKDNSKKTYIYNNSDIDEEIIKKLYDDPLVEEIVVTVDDNAVISEDLFKVIIGTDRVLTINTGGNQIIFNGNDIKNPKMIDAHMTVDTVNNDLELSGIVTNGFVINFASNGDLPGNALVRLRVTKDMNLTYGTTKVNVYYYDSVAKGFNKIATGLTPKDDYYEFAISHNSKYVLTGTKLADNLIVEEEDNNVVGFRQSNNTYLIMLVGALILALIALVIIFVVKNKKGKN